MALLPPPFPIRDRASLERYVLESAARLGLNGADVWKAVRTRKPAGQFILALLGVDEKLVTARHKPRDLSRAVAYETGVTRLLDAGKSETEAVSLVAREHGVQPDSVRRSRKRNPHAVAERFFDDRARSAAAPLFQAD